MNYCKECGHALKNDAQFCSACGTQTQPQVSKQLPARSSWGTKIRQATKKQKVIAISVLALLVLLIGGHQVGANMTDKNRIIEKFETALHEEDAKTIASMLQTSDERLDITEEKVSELLTLIAETPSAQQYFINELESQADAYEQGETIESSTIFSLEKEGKTALIYDNYFIEVMPFYFQVGTNMTDAKLFLGEEEIATSDADQFTKEYGPVLPGVYTLRSSYSNDYTVLENESTIELLEPYHQDQYVDLSLYGEYVSFNTEYASIADSISYFVNDTELDISEDEDFGPVSVDGSVEAHAVLTFPWGDVTTEKTPIDYAYIDLAVPNPFNEEMQTDIINTIHAFGQDYALAGEAMDASLFTTATDAFITEEAYSNYSYMEDWDERWTGTYKKAVVDLDSFYLYQTDDTYELSVNAAFYYDDAATYYVDDEEIDTAEEINEWEITFVYQADEASWLVADYAGLWSFNDENTVERVVETN
ncbi:MULTISPECIES: zinc ribbon domain-containing protein [Paraliobacillus]|uniref:zinc ribbon domain-containing protein n=1 Tax=Paraliobacillus TaxID=200903 RepID=UPI001300A87F|nr:MULTISPECIES: zinc-ribbon domain-containing protein [Paraliobacillus]